MSTDAPLNVFELAPFGIESVIIEPGSFATEAFGKLVTPDESRVLAGYGEMATKPQEMFAGMAELLNQPSSPDPQDVAEAVAKLIDTPAGERSLRTVVGTLTVAGIESLNQAYDTSKQEMLAAMDGGSR